MDTLYLVPRDDAQDDAITIAAGAIRRGQLVAFPTETVYGLGANIYDEHAVREIFRVKGRPEDNPMIVHVSSLDDVEALVMEIPEQFTRLAERFFPGPLTLILKRSAAVLDVVTAGLDTVAIRMPAHNVALQLIREAGVPLAAPSANISGKASPVTARQAFDDLKGKVFAVLDGGPCVVGIESTVLDLTNEQPAILRPGMISREEIEDALGAPIAVESDGMDAPRSPGMKYRHYAPEVPLRLVLHREQLPEILARELAHLKSKGLRVALFAPESCREAGGAVFYSFGGGSAVEYARLLYSGLRGVSSQDADIILCAGIPETGAGMAVMNRLRKSATEVIE